MNPGAKMQKYVEKKMRDAQRKRTKSIEEEETDKENDGLMPKNKIVKSNSGAQTINLSSRKQRERLEEEAEEAERAKIKEPVTMFTKLKGQHTTRAEIDAQQSLGQSKKSVGFS